MPWNFKPTLYFGTRYATALNSSKLLVIECKKGTLRELYMSERRVTPVLRILSAALAIHKTSILDVFQSHGEHMCTVFQMEIAPIFSGPSETLRVGSSIQSLSLSREKEPTTGTQMHLKNAPSSNPPNRQRQSNKPTLPTILTPHVSPTSTSPVPSPLPLPSAAVVTSG